MSAVNTWGVAPNVWTSESGALNVTMDDFTLSASGQVGEDIVGSLITAMDDFTLSASGSATNDVIGNLNITMDDFTLSAIGTLDQPVIGNLSIVMDDFVLITPSSGGNRFIAKIGISQIKASPINVTPIKVITK
jgi:hypothetical protein